MKIAAMVEHCGNMNTTVVSIDNKSTAEKYKKTISVAINTAMLIVLILDHFR
ncbi:hypothetical protein [Paenibacillus sinopodophylli]|uniref:hypothetical protein n=1 Tax=Paenibacillus sinopodophylli TaxID=1837342 RepID=UPI0014875670|nr:hypothetical protein [Paenibacillus sinopodophylli]